MLEVSHDLQTLKTLKKHLSSFLLVLKIDKEKNKLPRLDPKSNPAPNANHENSLGFFQLSKRGNRQSKAKLPKPSHEDEEST